MQENLTKNYANLIKNILSPSTSSSRKTEKIYIQKDNSEKIHKNPSAEETKAEENFDETNNEQTIKGFYF